VIRHPMSPVEFDTAVRRFIQLHSYLSVSSGRRSEEHNLAVGGDPESKHVYGMAVDLVTHPKSVQSHDVERMISTAKTLGLWAQWHDTGSGPHLHLQGLPTGPIELWWLDRYWGGVT